MKQEPFRSRQNQKFKKVIPEDQVRKMMAQAREIVVTDDRRPEEVQYSENFENAFKELVGLEGGYVNDPDDPGGETIFGVSRRAHPDWAVWDDIDALKHLGTPQEEWDTRPMLAYATELYYDRYWKRVHGEKFEGPEYYPFLLECFESCVNVGPKQFTKFLQTAANCFVGESFDILVDGMYGNKTLALVTKLVEDERRRKAFILALNVMQGYHYIHLVSQKPALRKYFMGWLGKRVTV